LTRGMVASSVSSVKSRGRRALGETGRKGYHPIKCATSYRVPFIFMKESPMKFISERPYSDAAAAQPYTTPLPVQWPAGSSFRQDSMVFRAIPS
jgi:hypothetical protein